MPLPVKICRNCIRALLLALLVTALPAYSQGMGDAFSCVSYRAILVGVDVPDGSSYKASDDIALLEAYFKAWLPETDVEVLVNRGARHEALYNTMQSVVGQNARVCTLIYFAGDVY